MRSFKTKYGIVTVYPRYVALKKHAFIAAMRNRWFSERSAVSDKGGKQVVSLLDGMEIVVSINPHSPTRATIVSHEKIAHPLQLFIFSIVYFSNIIFLNAQT